MRALMAGIRKIDGALFAIAGGVLVVMVLVTLCDVVLRNFGHPITGSMEIIMYGGAIVFGFSVPFGTFLKAQVQVDIVLSKLKDGPLRALNVVTRIVGVALFLFISWNFIQYGLDTIKTGEVTASFRLPYYPIVFALALSFLLQSLTILYDLLEVLRGEDAAAKEGAE
jgi:TRAP-type C4-dicarboxylate transport system permease small subunit